MENLKRSGAGELAHTALFVVVITVCSWISIPFAVPFTLQTFGVFCALAFLGGRQGTLAVTIYVFMGIVGIPVFSGFKGGFGVLLGPTGGFIAGFILAALIFWLSTSLWGRGTLVTALSMGVGMLICYVFGTIWFIEVYTQNTGSIALLTALCWCVFPFILPDTIKVILAIISAKKLSKIIKGK